MKSSSEMMLPVGATAEPNTCGSCQFFSRHDEQYNGDWVGRCTIRLPKKYQKVDWDGNTRPPALMNDADGCDLHRPDGKSYIVCRRVG